MASTKTPRTRVSLQARAITPAYEGWVTMVDAKALLNAALACTTKRDAARLADACLRLLAQELQVSNGKTALCLIDACALVGVKVSMSDLDIARVSK